MSMVVFNPDSVEPVDFAGPMRHPSAADPAGGMWLSDTEPSFIDTNALRKGRLEKLRGWMAEAGYGAIVLFDPYNQRYATGSRNMFGYFLRNSTRYFFIPRQGPIVLFEYPQSYHVSMALDTVDEARPSKLVWSSVSNRNEETTADFADEIADLLKSHGGGSMKIGLDRCNHLQALALEK
jgi:Xaa-Pro aminopeptidase